MSYEALIFESNTRPEVPVKLGENNFVLLGALHREVTAFESKCRKELKLVDGKLTNIPDHSLYETEFVGKSLYALRPNAEGKLERDSEPVGTEFAFSLRADIFDIILDKLKEISGIDARDARIKEENDRQKKRSGAVDGNTE